MLVKISNFQVVIRLQFDPENAERRKVMSKKNKTGEKGNKKNKEKELKPSSSPDPATDTRCIGCVLPAPATASKTKPN